MRLTRKHWIVAVILCAAGVAAYVWISKGKGNPDAAKPRGAAQLIKSGLAVQKTISLTVDANGYVTPWNIVEVRPQTQNIVRAVHVREGQVVRAGQLLFTLDQRADSAKLEKAQAQVERDRAELANAEVELKRAQDLLARNFVSPAQVDAARAKVDSLRNGLKADQAAAQSEKINLSNNRITASISGRLGAISVHEGSLAQPTGTPLVTIAQLDPIGIGFAVPERELAHIRSSYPNGDAPVLAYLPDRSQVSGKLAFIDNSVDIQSGTIRMKARFDNRDGKLWPGTYVNVRLTARTVPDAVVIPAQAIVTGPVDQFVYLVQPDETVKAQKIGVIAITGGQAAISGLQAGSRVVFEGAQNLRPGTKVREMPAGNQENGRKQKNAPK